MSPAIRIALPALLIACAYVLPPTWRAFDADPDDAAPAITRALDKKGLPIASLDAAKGRLLTEWTILTTAVDQVRERYVLTWEKDDDALTIYVRHEAQDRSQAGGAPAWGSVYHEPSKESALLDLVTAELGAE